tara:strand:- start:315 stop:458 length:144 start_codon:yes stop_codon:yes gene_type:complete
MVFPETVTIGGGLDSHPPSHKTVATKRVINLDLGTTVSIKNFLTEPL